VWLDTTLDTTPTSRPHSMHRRSPEARSHVSQTASTCRHNAHISSAEHAPQATGTRPHNVSQTARTSRHNAHISSAEHAPQATGTRLHNVSQTARTVRIALRVPAYATCAACLLFTCSCSWIAHACGAWVCIFHAGAWQCLLCLPCLGTCVLTGDMRTSYGSITPRVMGLSHRESLFLLCLLISTRAVLYTMLVIAMCTCNSNVP
jgi:hypothetical protein